MTTDLYKRFETTNYTTTLSSGTQYRIDVAELYRGPVVDLGAAGYSRDETYSLITKPNTGRGRSVGAFLQIVRTAELVGLNIDSGLTLGTNTTVQGSATISDGSSAGAACDSAAATSAILHSDSTYLHTKGEGITIVGSVTQDTRSTTELMDFTLDGHSIDELAALAHIKFGPLFSKPAFSGSPKWDNSVVNYRWGCPTQLVTGCSAAQAAYFPTVAIDANGGEVDLQGEHGQGIIVVLNGDILIRGNFKYGGIIIVEGKLTVTGTPKIEGAVIAMGDKAIIDADASEISSGNSLIRYNECQIVNAIKAMTLQMLSTSPQNIASPTHAWYEVVK
jgi:hypothetical protein